MEIVEVGPRDGLQNEEISISVSQKIALIDALSQVGFTRIESASFVSAKWVPQMAGASEVMGGIHRTKGVTYTALTPNLRGLKDALVAGANEVAVFGSASESFSKANINASISESLERFRPVVAEALDAGVKVRGYVSCVTDCPYEGPIEPAAVARVSSSLAELGCFEISLGETLGRGTPERVDAMLSAVLNTIAPEDLAGHFHDTSGQALDNVGVALGRGLRVFDAAIAGLGGCPYAPGAAGNVSTLALANYLSAAGHEHGLNLAKLSEAEAYAHAMRGVTS